MKRTLFAIVAAALLTLPAACMHPGYRHGGPGGPGGPGGCPKHQSCGCRQRAPQCQCPDCECKKGGVCKCPKPNCQQQQPQEQAPAAK